MTAPREVHDFNQVDGRPVQLDLWSYAKESSPKPAIIYFHGGGLCAGNRRSVVPTFLHTAAKNHGWSFISADYRLMIPGTAQDMYNDVHALFAYISKSIPQIDPHKIAVGGGSAGGYLARLAALYAQPRPAAMYSLYGIGGDFFSEFHMEPPPWRSGAALESIKPMTEPTPAQKAELVQEWDVPFPPDKDPTGHSTTNVLRTSFALWTGLTTNGTVLDFLVDSPGLGKALRQSKQAKNPSAPVKADNPSVSTTTKAGGEEALVDLSIIPPAVLKFIPQLSPALNESHPPTHLSHGLADGSVVPGESIRTYDQLQALGVDSELVLLPNKGHMFEWGNEDDPEVKVVLDGIVRFLEKHLETK